MSRKSSLAEAITQMGPQILATQVAGVEVKPNKSWMRKLSSASEKISLQEDFEIPWGDQEERLYREWLREMRQKCENEIDFKEYETEEKYRAQLREEAKSKEDDPIDWEDEQEREFRRRYIEMRRLQLMEEANFDEYKAEQEYRDRIKEVDRTTNNNPIVWDDEAERKCQASYRKKYSNRRRH